MLNRYSKHRRLWHKVVFLFLAFAKEGQAPFTKIVNIAEEVNMLLF